MALGSRDFFDITNVDFDGDGWTTTSSNFGQQQQIQNLNEAHQQMRMQHQQMQGQVQRQLENARMQMNSARSLLPGTGFTYTVSPTKPVKVRPKGKEKCSNRRHKMCCYNTRNDDSLVSYIAAPIWLMAYILTFGRWGKLLYKYT